MLIGNIKFSFHSLDPLILKTLTLVSESNRKAVFYAEYKDTQLVGFASSIGVHVSSSEIDAMLTTLPIPLETLNSETHDGIERICGNNSALDYGFLIRISSFLGALFLKQGVLIPAPDSFDGTDKN